MFFNKSPKHSHDLAEQAGPLMGNVGNHASHLAEDAMDAVHNSSQEIQRQTTRASESTIKYIKNEPIKALLVSAATGATLMMLVNLMFHSRHRD